MIMDVEELASVLAELDRQPGGFYGRSYQENAEFIVNQLALSSVCGPSTDK